MKIARNVPVSGRHDEWHPPSVGAMKIARNVAASEWPDEWYAPIPGSLSEGAGEGLHHSSGYSLKSGVTGDFHRPYETQRI